MFFRPKILNCVAIRIDWLVLVEFGTYLPSLLALKAVLTNGIFLGSMKYLMKAARAYKRPCIMDVSPRGGRVKPKAVRRRSVNMEETTLRPNGCKNDGNKLKSTLRVASARAAFAGAYRACSTSYDDIQNHEKRWQGVQQQVEAVW